MKNFTKWWKSFSFQLLGGLHQLSSLRYWWAIFISSWRPCHSQWCSCWTHPATPACRPGRPSPRGGRILKKGNTGQFIVEIALYHFQNSYVLEFQIWSIHLSTVTFMFTKIGQYWSQKNSSIASKQRCWWVVTYWNVRCSYFQGPACTVFGQNCKHWCFSRYLATKHKHEWRNASESSCHLLRWLG